MVFLFFNNYKGEKNDGPNKNVHGLKYCSSTLTTVGWGSLRPPTDDSYSGDWGEDVLGQSNKKEKTSFKQYCMINSCTDEGLQAIAKYNGYEKKWDEIKKELDDSTSMAAKRFLSIKLYAKHRNKRNTILIR